MDNKTGKGKIGHDNNTFKQYKAHGDVHHDTNATITATTDNIGVPPSFTGNTRDSFIIHSPLKNLSPNTIPFLNLCNSPQQRKSSMLLSHQYQFHRNHSEGSCHGFPGLTSPIPCCFGDFTDQSKMGELPNEEDLFMKFLDVGETTDNIQHDVVANNGNQSKRVLVNTGNAALLDGGVGDGVLVPMPKSARGGAGQIINSTGHHQQRLVLPPHLDLTQAGRRVRSSIAPAVMRKRRLSSSSLEGDSDELTISESTCNSDDSNDDSFDTAALQPRRRAPAKTTKKKTASTAAATTAPKKKKKTAANKTAHEALSSPAVKQSFTGVSHHRLTQRWEASLWLRGRQLYLGGFDNQENAARAYDLAALACKGPNASINFPASDYEEQLKEVKGFSCEEVVAYVRRRSTAFSRGKSKYRGVSGHHGRWEARIGSFNGRKNVSFGIFDTEEEAARQYDRALILEKGRSAKTNFPLRDYDAEVQQYKMEMASVCGNLRGPARIKHIEAYTLPKGRVTTSDERKKATIIYAEALRIALEKQC